MNHRHDGQTLRALFRNPLHATGLMVIGGGLVYYLLTRHWTHVSNALPWLFVLACPLMHLFMHRGSHGAHGGQNDKQDDSPKRDGPGQSS